MAAKPIKTEVLVVGAGLVGLTSAIAAQQLGYETVLLDRQAAPKRFKPRKAQDWDQRIYAISPQNAQWLERLGVWQRLDQSRICPMSAMHIWGDSNQAPLILNAEEVPVDNLGYIVESSALMDACYQTVQTAEIKTLFNRQCETISSSLNQTTLTVKAKTQSQQLETDLLMAADGGNSWVRTQLNIPKLGKQYSQTAIVANFEVEKDHQCIARQWFRQTGEEALDILAWLPMPDRTISIVWSLPTKKAAALMQLSSLDFTEQVQAAGGATLGALKLVTPAASFPLQLSGALNPVHQSTLLFGDAAHRIHPLAGQGVNLGFRDVIQWQTIMGGKHAYQALNDPQLLKQFSRQRQLDVASMATLTDGLYRLFNAKHPLIKSVRDWGLQVTNSQAMKRLLIKQAVHA